MILSLIGHGYRYETENVIRLFFPLEKITVIQTPFSENDEGVITVVEKTGSKSRIICEAKISGKSLRRETVLENPDKASEELAAAQLVFKNLSEITGITPKWGALTGVRPSKLMRTLIKEKGEEAAKRYFTESLYVSPEKADLAAEVAGAEEEIISLSRKNSYSLYVSIPFCPTRCSYCSFVSHSVQQAKKLMPRYIELLCRELRQFSEIAGDLGLKLETVYFGGGTPTSLNEDELKAVTDAVYKYFHVKNIREYTIEAGRPDTLTREKLRIMKNAGVTRISINPQTFNDSVLKEIGRNHTSEKTLEAYRWAREEGFDNINMDFIAGLPGDSPESFRKSIDRAVKLNPENITVHTLALKRAAEIVTANRENTVAAETAQMLEYSSKALKDAGYSPYYMYRQSKCVGNLENVGWSRNFYRCLYNIYMMEEVHTVFAAGAGGVTKLKAPESGVIERIFNFKYPYEYINRFNELTERKNRIYEFYKEHKTTDN